MGTNGFPAYDTNSLVVRPLAELATLRLADPAHDLRGWNVQGHDGHPVGRVEDLLVDVDRLRADTLLVSLAGGARAGVLVAVPLEGLSPDAATRRLVPGDGMPPIALRYPSTTRYVIGVTVAVVILALAAWVLSLIGSG